MAKKKGSLKLMLDIFMALGVFSIVFIILTCQTDAYELRTFGDVCCFRSLQNYGLRSCQVLRIQRFDSRTKWPTELANDFDPVTIMELGKDPGLGIRQLHERGITGKNISVAVIDGPLLLNHQEYRDRVAYYRPPPGLLRFKKPVYHASMVVSILGGKTTGVAPECKIHYFGGDLDKFDSIPLIIREIIKYNKGLSTRDKIRVISVSAGCALPHWMEAIAEAAENGITVVTSAEMFGGMELGGVQCPLGQDRDNPTNYQTCYFMKSMMINNGSGRLCVPIDNRTFADFKSEDGYIFNPSGGMSEGVPYFAGLVALLCQVNPDLTTSELMAVVLESATPFGKAFIVNPWGAVQLAEEKALPPIP